MRTIDIKKVYDETPTEVIAENLNNVLHTYDVKPQTIVKMLGCSIHTAYGYRKTNYPGRPDLLHLMILAEQLRLDVIDDFLKKPEPVPKRIPIKIPGKRT